MSFLQPILLFALPLALLPVIIHLIHMHRRRVVKWAAMMFLLAAQRMNKGLSRLRQILILTARVLAVAAMIFVITRPLAGGLLGLTGGAPDSVIILLDRSASMEQQNLATGVSKRLAGLRNLTAAIKDAYGTRSRLVLIDSATLKPEAFEKADALLDLPQSAATDTAADVPTLLQAGMDYITANQTGRTDVWVVSDLRQTDWDSAGGRWEALRSGFAALPGVRFQVLGYPEVAAANVAIQVERVVRRETADKAELLLDVRITRQGDDLQPLPLDLRVVVNGIGSSLKVEMKDAQMMLQAQAIPIDKKLKRGWGSVELPADTSPADNVSHFVFDEPPVLKSVIISDQPEVAQPLAAALQAAMDPARKYAASVLPSMRAAEVPWVETGLLVWQAALPKADDVVAQQLIDQVKAGRRVLFLPPEVAGGDSLLGLQWGDWKNAASEKTASPEWWRNDAGPLANTRAGVALPVGELEVSRWREITGDAVPLARLAENAPLLLRAAGEDLGAAYFLTTLPSPGSSSLARDGVVMFALLHRLLNDGALGLGQAQQRIAGLKSLGADPAVWTRLDRETMADAVAERALSSGVYEKPSADGKRGKEVLVALNRPLNEDAAPVLSRAAVDELFTGLDYRYLEDNLEQGRSLTSEIWRTFLMVMACAMVLEALLCIPARRAPAPEGFSPAVPGS